MLVGAFLVGASAALFFGSPLSRVNEIRVEGVHSLSREKVAEAAGVPVGTLWLRIKPDAVAERIRDAFPLVAEARVDIHWNGVVSISVREKDVVAVFPAETAWFRLLEDGTVLDPVRSGESIRAPIITVNRPVSVAPGRPVPVEAVGQACRQLSKLPPELREQLSEIHIEEGDVWTVYSVDRYKLHVPAGSFADRLRWFPAIRDQVRDRGPGEIWLTEPFRYHPFRPEKESAG